MNKTYDRAREDLGNSVGLEHLNLTIPDQQPATAFYIMGLGLTRDPYLVTGLQNMWINVGRNQFHLPIGKPQAVRGHVAQRGQGTGPDQNGEGRNRQASLLHQHDREHDQYAVGVQQFKKIGHVDQCS